MVNFPLLNHPRLQALMLALRGLEPVLIMLAGYASYALRHDIMAVPLRYNVLIALAGLLYAFMATLTGCYATHALRRAWQFTPLLASTLLMTLVCLVAGLFLLKISSDFSRIWLLLWWGFALVAIVVARVGAEYYLKRARRKGFWQRKVAVYGVTTKTFPLLEELQQAKNIGLALVGVYEDDAKKVSPDLKASGLLRGGLAQLLADAQAGRIDDIIVAVDITQHPEADKLLAQLHAMPLNVFYCLPLPFFGRVQQDILLTGVPLVQLYHTPMEGQSLWLKRALDISVSGAALVALSPAMVVIAALVKLTSPGPVFFTQKRGGFNGQTFQMMKFRSMRSDAATVKDASGKEQQATQNDPRITPLGRFLRKSSMDELPQLLNVLKGDMSLVGPRPHAMSHDSYYAQLVDRYASRQKMRPGLTGWAQLNGWRGETDTLDKMAKRVEYDIWYIENYTFGLDLKILFLTPFIVFRQKTAY